MKQLPALVLALEALKQDAALRPGGRGARKVLVTEIYGATETEATKIEWEAPVAGSKCPVRVTPDLEVAVFNQEARQDRHYHRLATEIYSVLEGSMVIEVEGVLHKLSAGDMIVVTPGAVHEVKPSGTNFLCSVIAANSGGASDKYTA